MEENNLLCAVWPAVQYVRIAQELFAPFESVSLIVYKVYCMYKKSWPILYCKLLYKIGQDLLCIKYNKPTVLFGWGYVIQGKKM